MVGMFPYNYFFVQYCLHEILGAAWNIRMCAVSNAFSKLMVSTKVVALYSRTYSTAPRKKFRFISYGREDFHILWNL